MHGSLVLARLNNRMYYGGWHLEHPNIPSTPHSSLVPLSGDHPSSTVHSHFRHHVAGLTVRGFRVNTFCGLYSSWSGVFCSSCSFVSEADPRGRLQPRFVPLCLRRCSARLPCCSALSLLTDAWVVSSFRLLWIRLLFFFLWMRISLEHTSRYWIAS